MTTEDPKEMEQRLTQYIRDARQALEILASLDPSDFDLPQLIEPGSDYERYIQTLHQLNHARTWLSMATEPLRRQAEGYEDRMIAVTQAHREPINASIGAYPGEIPKWIRKGDNRIKKPAVTITSSGEVVRGTITAILKYSDGSERIEITRGTPRTGTTKVWASPATVYIQ